MWSRGVQKSNLNHGVGAVRWLLKTPGLSGNALVPTKCLVLGTCRWGGVVVVEGVVGGGEYWTRMKRGARTEMKEN